jgi:hypothetical protein
MSKKLLFSVTKNDFEVQHFCAGGKGGQNQNKTASGTRIIHRESGAVGEARDAREQRINKKNAFDRLFKSKKFQLWLKMETGRKLGEKSIDEIVAEQMQEKNIKIEVKDENGRWTEERAEGAKG